MQNKQEEQKKEQLVEELDQELDLEGEDKDKPEETDKKVEEKKSDSQDKSSFDEEDVKADEEGVKATTQISTETKLSKDKAAEINPRKHIDYSLIDYLVGFVDTDEELQPILCGYFLKIMVQMLAK